MLSLDLGLTRTCEKVKLAIFGDCSDHSHFHTTMPSFGCHVGETRWNVELPSMRICIFIIFRQAYVKHLVLKIFLIAFSYMADCDENMNYFPNKTTYCFPFAFHSCEY